MTKSLTLSGKEGSVCGLLEVDLVAWVGLEMLADFGFGIRLIFV